MNNSSMTDYQFREGDDVIAADGEKLGSIASVGQNYLLVEKGFFFIKDYYVPFTAISSYDESDGRVFLSTTRDEALNSGWDQMPMTDSGMTGGGIASGRTGDVGAAGWDADRDQSRLEGGEHITVPVHEEELTATKTAREAGDVQVNKRVVAEERTLEVPATEERVQVTRRAVDRDATTGEDVFVEERIDVPLRTEDVNLEKRTRVAEEIDIDKQAVRRTERVSGTVRKEVVDVDDVSADAAMRRDRESGRDSTA